jgi:ATP-dependent helicase/nuclease subunit A
MSAPLSLGRNLALFAGAGAGKTHGLITLCLHVLAGAREAEPVPPGKLCLVTFTEKAAAEMRQRLVQRVEALARGGSEPELKESFEALGRPMPDARFWRGVLEGLPGASIATFHALCLGLLRRTPGAIDPGASLLDPEEAIALLGDCVERIVLERLEAGDARVKALCRELPFSGDRAGLVQSLGKILTRLREEGIAPREVARSNAAELRSEFDAQLGRAKDAVAEAMRLDAKRDFLEPHLACARAFEGLGFDNAYSARGALESAAGQVRSSRKGGAPLKAANKALTRAVLGNDDEKLPGLFELRASWDAAHHEETFVELLEAVQQRYASELERRGAIDFGVMLTRARDLLRDDRALRRDVQERIGVLLVDEFQDTNRLQLELVLMLAERQEGGPRPIEEGDFEALPLEPAKLCIVGDRKQSIYDFRGADVALFERLAAKIVREGGERAALQRSWRSSPELVGVFNEVFAGVLAPGADARDYEVVYRQELDDLEPVRTPRGGAPVEVWSFGEAKSGDERKSDDAEAVARGIRRLFAEGVEIELRDRTRRPLMGGDIAILLRSFGPVEFYRQALLRHGIPHRIVRGRGLFAAQEVLDVASWLALLADPTDGLAAAAVLRSPFVGISDAGLVALGLQVPGLSLERIARGLPENLGAEDRERVTRFLERFERWKAARGRVGLERLLELALDETGFRATLAATPLGEQSLANVEKLLARAAAWEDRRPGDLEGFATELRRLVDDNPDEAQADAFDLADPRAVQLLTVHQAKGLEWPVVVLPNLGGRSPNETDPVLFDRALGLALRPRLPDAASTGHSPRSGRLAQESLRRRRAESLRVLYVAMTRARDRLILTGVEDGVAGTWAGALRSWLEGAPEATVKRVVLDELELPTRDAAPGSTGDAAIARATVERVRARETARSSSVVLPVTQLQDFALCPRRFHLLHEAGLIERPQVFDLSDPGEKSPGGELEDPRDQGRLAHRLLERIDFAEAGRNPAAALERLIDREQAQHASGREVRGWVETFLRGPFAARLASLDPARIRREVPFVLRVSERPALLLKGQIDLLVEEEDGTATVVDYKAAKRHPKGEQAYAFQLACYALAARAWSGRSRAVRTGLVYLKEPTATEQLRLVPEAELTAFSDRLGGLAQTLAGSPLNGPWEGRPQPTCAELRCGLMSRCHPRTAGL